MPEIARFYGIIIKLFFGDHPPHIFTRCMASMFGVFRIDTLEMIEGDLPNRAKKLVVEWAELHRQELTDMWDTQTFRKLAPLS